jgi:hypothetical protein
VAELRDLSARIAAAVDTAAQCSGAETAENYGRLCEQLGEIETAAGQFLRSHAEYQPLLNKLQQGGALSADELKTLRSLIIGDADDYLKYDDDFVQAKRELDRIIAKIRQLQSRHLSLEGLMYLRVLCREASSALTPTEHYLEQKERVRNFEEHTRGPLSSETRHMLAGIIKDMVA